MKEWKGEDPGPVGPNPWVVAPFSPIQLEQFIDPKNTPDQGEKKKGSPQRIKQSIAIEYRGIPSGLKGLGQVPHEVKIAMWAPVGFCQDSTRQIG